MPGAPRPFIREFEHAGRSSRLSPTRANLQGFTAEGLAAFNAGFHDLVDERKLANVVTLVARHGEIVNLDAYGVLDVVRRRSRCRSTASSASPR